MQSAIINLEIKDKHTLFSSYMPFVKNGGIFVPTEKTYSMGQEIFVLMRLLDTAEKLPVAGKVVWITPPGCQGNRVAGIGIQFSEENNADAHSKIETLLGGALKSDRVTMTM